MKRISIFGGSGTLGTILTTKLAKEGYFVKLFSRNKNIQTDASCAPNVKCINGATLDTLDIVREELAGSDAVINLMGTWDGKLKRAEVTHHKFPLAIFELCEALSIPRMLHISALGADQENDSVYFKTKRAGEEALLKKAESAKTKLTIVRSSLMLGHDDPFSYQMSRLVEFLPIVPLPLHDAKFQPVLLDDVVLALMALLNQVPATPVIEIAGPQEYTLYELVREIADYAKQEKKRLIRVPNGLTALFATLFGWVWGAPLTKNQYLATKVPSTTEQNALPSLGIEPTPIESLFPHVAEFKVHDKYRYDRASARRS